MQTSGTFYIFALRKYLKYMEKFNRICISDNVPKTGITYYYFHACMSTHRFILKYTQWFDGEADAFRFSKGNFFLSEKDANEVIDQLNEVYVDVMNLISIRRKEDNRQSLI